MTVKKLYSKVLLRRCIYIYIKIELLRHSRYDGGNKLPLCQYMFHLWIGVTWRYEKRPFILYFEGVLLQHF